MLIDKRGVRLYHVEVLGSLNFLSVPQPVRLNRFTHPPQIHQWRLHPVLAGAQANGVIARLRRDGHLFRKGHVKFRFHAAYTMRTERDNCMAVGQ